MRTTQTKKTFKWIVMYSFENQMKRFLSLYRVNTINTYNILHTTPFTISFDRFYYYTVYVIQNSASCEHF